MTLEVVSMAHKLLHFIDQYMQELLNENIDYVIYRHHKQIIVNTYKEA